VVINLKKGIRKKAMAIQYHCYISDAS